MYRICDWYTGETIEAFYSEEYRDAWEDAHCTRYIDGLYIEDGDRDRKVYEEQD